MPLLTPILSPDMPVPKRIVIVAGEESGDIHAAHMADALLKAHPDLRLSGIGGRHMQKSGVHLISDLARFGVTGIFEVIRHAFVIKKAFSAIKAHLEKEKPDLLILVDYPGFNLRLAKYAKETLGLKIIYYISPQIWAWKANRINTLKTCIDHMAVILPFEKSIYKQANIPVSFVGHPLTHTIPTFAKPQELRQTLGLPHDKKIVALLPGSRRNEIERHMPVLAQASMQLSAKIENLHFVIPIAGSLDPQSIKKHFSEHCRNVTFITGQSLAVTAASDCVIVASGTASLECALLLKPMCIIYKTSFLTYIAASKLIKVKYLGLCNLLQNKMMVSELLQYDCNKHELSKLTEELLFNPKKIAHMTSSLQRLKTSLSSEQADCSISELVIKELFS